MIYSLDRLRCTRKEVSVKINGKWVPARPKKGAFRMRIKAAWLCLTGRADAVLWPEGQ